MKPSPNPDSDPGDAAPTKGGGRTPPAEAVSHLPQSIKEGARIDHILTSSGLATHATSAAVLQPPELDYASDHYPAMAEFSFPGQESGATAMRIITYNVLEGILQDRERGDRIATWLTRVQPDIVAFQELNGFTPDRLRHYARRWGHHHSTLLKEDGYSTGLTANRPIAPIRRVREGFWHGLLCARTWGIWFYVIHFAPKSDRHAIRESEAQRVLAEISREIRQGDPVILLGDFNSLSPRDYPNYDGPYIQPIKQFLDAGFIDLVYEKRTGAKCLHSMPTPLIKTQIPPHTS